MLTQLLQVIFHWAHILLDGVRAFPVGGEFAVSWAVAGACGHLAGTTGVVLLSAYLVLLGLSLLDMLADHQGDLVNPLLQCLG